MVNEKVSAIYTVKRQPTDLETISVNHISDKMPISPKYKELLPVKSKKTQTTQFIVLCKGSE